MAQKKKAVKATTPKATKAPKESCDKPAKTSTAKVRCSW